MLRRARAVGARSGVPGHLPGLRPRGRPDLRRPASRPSTRGSAQPGGGPIGMPADIPAPLLQVEWCAPFSGPVRDALHDAEVRRVSGGWRDRSARPSPGAGSGPARAATSSCPSRSTPTASAQRGYDQAALIAEVGGAPLGLPLAPVLERERATVAQFDLDRDERPPTSPARSGSGGAGPGGTRRRPLGRARGRRHDDRRDAGGLRDGAARGAAPTAVSAVTVARER